VRTAQQSQTRSLSLAQFSTCRWAVQNWSVFVTSLFLERLMAALKGKAVMKIGTQYGKLIAEARS